MRETGPGRLAGTGRAAARLAAAGLLAAGLPAAVVGCAKEEPPPGALPDQRPPDVREIVPAPGSVVPGLDEPVRIRFDEPIQQPGSGYAREMESSPAYRYRLTAGFSEIRVQPRDGWRAGAVYVFRLPGGLRDLLGNEREEPIEVTFSTGPDVTDTRISGRIRDRLTGEGVRDARLLVLAEDGDSVPYTAVSDTGGVVSLPAVPPGRYTAYGFRDLNANLTLDRRLEPYDSAAVRLEGPSAAARVTLRMVPPDSTAPVLARAGALDSLTVVLAFDDPLDPGQPLAEGVAVRPAGAEEPIPVERVRLSAPEEEPAEPAPGDTLPADAPPDDTLAAPDTTPAAADTLPREPAAADTLPAADTLAADTLPADTLPLPSDSLYLRLARPLEPGRTYRASATGLLNLRGLAGGGDTTFVYTRPDTVPADTLPADTVPADTVPAGEGVPPDTAGGEEAAPADTAGAGQGPPPASGPARPGGGAGRRRRGPA